MWTPRTRSILAVLSLTAIAAAMRFHDLGRWSAWGDEIYTFDVGQGILGGRAPDALRTMPLAYLFTRLGIALFGAPATELSIRFFPAVFGVLLIPVLALLLARLLDRRTALVAALIATFCPWLLFQSQFARYYSLLLLATTASALLYAQALKSGSLRAMIGSALCFGLAALTHPTAMLLLPVYSLHFPLARRLLASRPRARLITPYLIVLALGLVAAVINRDAVLS